MQEPNKVITYACAWVSDCLRLMIFTCTDLLGTLLGAAGSNVGVRHGEVTVFKELEGLQIGEMELFVDS